MSNIVPGILFTYFAIAIVLAVPVSLVLLAWYRRAVRDNMRARSAAAGAAPLPVHGAGATSKSTPKPAAPGGTGVRVRLISIYTLAAIAASAVTTCLYFLSPGMEFSALRAFVMGYGFCWPLAPSLAALLAMPRRYSMLLALAYYAAGAVIILVWSAFSLVVLGRQDVSPVSNTVGYTVFLLTVATLPFAVIVVTGGRKVRPVTPLVMAGLLVFSFAALVLQAGFVALLDSAAMRNLLLPFHRAPVVWFMLVALPVGYVCWAVLRGLGRRYERKTFSDTQLLVDTWWLIAAFSSCVFLANDLQWRGLLGLFAFVAYRATVAAGLALRPLDHGVSAPRRLLLLRVFGYQRRTEKLFDAIGQRWRLEGSVNMIAGADLAGRTIDPGDIVSFAGGGLHDQFVQNGGDLQRRLDSLDETRDPDGRFRVNEFFCHDDTWRPTLEWLLLSSDAVLMDLRGFTRDNSGCLFELQKLVQHHKLDRSLFVVDDKTDVDLLRGTLAEAARDAGAPVEPALHVQAATRQSGGELRRILIELRALAAA